MGYVTKIKRREKRRERIGWSPERERNKRQLHSDKTNGFQFYVEKMKHSLAAIRKKGKGKNWEMVSSNQLKTTHTHTHLAIMTHPCIYMCVFTYVFSLLVLFCEVVDVVGVSPLFICRIQLINKMRCRRFMCRSK